MSQALHTTFPPTTSSFWFLVSSTSRQCTLDRVNIELVLALANARPLIDPIPSTRLPIRATANADIACLRTLSSTRCATAAGCSFRLPQRLTVVDRVGRLHLHYGPAPCSGAVDGKDAEVIRKTKMVTPSGHITGIAHCTPTSTSSSASSRRSSPRLHSTPASTTSALYPSHTLMLVLHAASRYAVERMLLPASSTSIAGAPIRVGGEYGVYCGVDMARKGVFDPAMRDVVGLLLPRMDLSALRQSPRHRLFLGFLPLHRLLPASSVVVSSAPDRIRSSPSCRREHGCCRGVCAPGPVGVETKRRVALGWMGSGDRWRIMVTDSATPAHLARYISTLSQVALTAVGASQAKRQAARSSPALPWYHGRVRCLWARAVVGVGCNVSPPSPPLALETSLEFCLDSDFHRPRLASSSSVKA
ncbi:hypothetical protein C8R45DRAFT_1221544 [Mycena sanguinolenta]|nr:hypothetical protein C8R45DRAFT_1221544 [Mycena sanguinolenta]